MPFVRRIGVCIDEADHHAIDVLRAECRGNRFQLLFRERHVNHAVRPHPLLHLEAQVARHQGRWEIGMDIVDLGADLAADFQQVAKALRGHHGDLAATPLD